jgi:hypothetical protein
LYAYNECTNKINFRKSDRFLRLPTCWNNYFSKGTKSATVTNNGITILKLKEEKSSLFIYRITKVLINNEENQNIVLDDNSVALGEVVVTALGIKRDKRALGYASQELKSDDINKVINELCFQLNRENIRSSNYWFW